MFKSFSAGTREDYHAMLAAAPASPNRLREQVKKLREALEQIEDNSTEDNEWDAVDKLHENQRLATHALKQSE
jgi:hypothetical protein